MDKYLLTLAFLLLFVEVGWLADDLQLIDLSVLSKRTSNSEGSSLGQITTIKKDVRKKSNSSLVWEDTKDSQKVFAFDSVLTLDQSAAEVSLNSGTVITLHENTLVSIEPTNSDDKNRGPVLLRFHKGIIRAVGGRDPTSVDAGDWVIQAQPDSKITIRSRGPNQYSVESTEGAAKVVNPKTNETSQIIDQGQSVDLDEKSISNVKTVMKLEWTTPADNERIYTHKDTSEVHVTWQGPATAVGIFYPESLHEVERPIPADSGGVFNMLLTVGNYTLRMKNGSDATFARNIGVWQAPKIFLLNPLPRERFKSNSKINFQWTLNQDVAKYVLQLASDSEFKQLVKEVETEENTAKLSQIPDGNYYWRVLGKDELGFLIPEMYSNSLSVLSKPLEAPKLRAPKVVPENDSLLERIWNLLIPSANADEVPGATPLPRHYKAEFRWEKVDGADGGYAIEISETADFQNVLVSETVPHAHFAWKNFKLGKYYWRVAARSKDGEQGLFSEIAKADLTSIPIAPITPEGPVAQAEPEPTPTPKATPAVIALKPTPTPTPPLEPLYYLQTNSVELGGHYLGGYFKGKDYSAETLGPYLGDLRIQTKSLLELKDWHEEIEFARTQLAPTSQSQFPLQNAVLNYSVRVTVMKENPYKDHFNFGITVHNQFPIFGRATLDSLNIMYPVVAGVDFDWLHHFRNHELRYRLTPGIVVPFNDGFAMEGRASYAWILPLSDKKLATITVEGRAASGILLDGSYWSTGAGFLFFGLRW